MGHDVNWKFTIVSVPFPFKGADGVRQRSAIQSWLHLEPTPEIILMGDDEGVPEYAQEHGSVSYTHLTLPTSDLV